MEQFWNLELPVVIGGCATVGALILLIGGVIIRSVFSKLIAKINVEKITETAVDKGTETLKKLAFTQTIQPIAESELVKVREEAVKIAKALVEENNKKVDKNTEILIALCSYFDNSIGVSEEKKEELHKLISEVKDVEKIDNTITLSEIVANEIKVVEEIDGKEEKSNVER